MSCATGATGSKWSGYSAARWASSAIGSGEDLTPLEAQVGRHAHSYRIPDPEGTRAGAFILAAYGPGAPYREKLVCVGRKHPRYERVVTPERAARAYYATVAAGRTSIGLADLSRA